jgi:hypothetical protein
MNPFWLMRIWLNVWLDWWYGWDIVDLERARTKLRDYAHAPGGVTSFTQREFRALNARRRR